MKGYRNFLIVVSAAFLVFSALYGSGYDKLRQDYGAVGRYSYGFVLPPPPAPVPAGATA